MMKRRHVLTLPAVALLARRPWPRVDAMDPELRRRAKRAVAGGLHYLRGQQAADGSLLKSVGITALALRALPREPREVQRGDGPFITRQVEFLLANVKPDGSISASLQATAYNTAVAINALVATENPKYEAGDRGCAQLPDHAPDRRRRRLQARPPPTTAASATAATSGPTCRTSTSRSKA